MRVLNGTELRLYGPVGYADGGEGFTAGDVVDALAAVGTDADITVRINSGGGWAHEGVAIHTALSAHRGRVAVQVDAVALSAASIIAMAGDEITMATGSIMMIHDPSLITAGTVEDHGRSVEQLRATAAAMATVYAARTGKTVASIRAAMKDELWMTADQAVAAGYADRTGTGKATSSLDTRAAISAGWAKAAARHNGPPAVKVEAANERVEAIRVAAAERGVTALGEELATGKLPVAEALAMLYRHTARTVMTSAVQGSPTLAAILAGRRGAP